MLIDRYIIHEISKPLMVIFAILLVIFVSYSATHYLADAVSGQLPRSTVISLILLKTVKALEILLSMALYLSIVLTMRRLYTNFEMTALAVSGVSNIRIFLVILNLCLLFAALIACLSLFVRPWAYKEMHRLRTQAKTKFDIAQLEPGHFHSIGPENRVVFVEKVDSHRNRAKRVFIQDEHNGTLQVTYAKQVYQKVDMTSGDRILFFLNGYRYEFALNRKADQILKFKQFIIHLPKETVPVEYKSKAASIMQLARSDDPEDIAEFQWRLSMPLSTVLLGLLAVPLGRTTLQQGKCIKTPVAVVIFAVYYNSILMAKTWVEHGVVDTVPGIWWVHALLACLFLALIWKQR
ncbi:MAG: LPS export ABC transporter permease LptF [Deltaproteobacteria bacterium]|nr:LPS export ABC transporter permease LptF [Deltaproteobacteria bacterium]